MILSKLAAMRRAGIKKDLHKKSIQGMKENCAAYLSLRQVCTLLDVNPDTVKLTAGMDMDTPFTGICAWDYYLIPGCLYAALPLYANQTPDAAIAKGATVLLTDRQEKNYPCIVVPDVMEAYCCLCAAIRSAFSQPAVAVTGSVGKTTTKDMVNCVFSQSYKTFCDVENNNMATLVGHLAQHIPANCEYYIQEVHEGDPDSARLISAILRPRVAVVTNIGESHLGNFGSYEGLVKGVTDITAGMPEDGIVVINGDDVRCAGAEWDRKTIRVSIKDPQADYFADHIIDTAEGQSFEIVWHGGRISARIYMKGLHNVIDALLAFTAGVESGVPSEKAVEGIEAYRPKGMRQNIIKQGGRTLYIDCFNASVKSMESALETLSKLSGNSGAKRIAVLGDMAELGEDSQELHAKVGDMAGASGIDVLICYGPMSFAMAEAAQKTGKIQVHHVEKRDELNNLVRKTVGPRDIVLFKASHSTNLATTIRSVFPMAYFRTIYMDRLRRHFARSSSMK